MMNREKEEMIQQMKHEFGEAMHQKEEMLKVRWLELHCIALHCIG